VENSSWKDVLSSDQVSKVFEILDRCLGATNGQKFKEIVVESIASVLDVRDVTFYVGADYGSTFQDPAPILTGATSTLLEEYRERWWDKDPFALPEARREFDRAGFVTLGQLRSLADPQYSYIVDWMMPNGIGTASAIHLQTADGEALVGLFDREMTWNRSDLLCVTVLARHLRAACRDLDLGTARQSEVRQSPVSRLTERQREVAGLVSQGLSNVEIARRLSLTEHTVKKHLSRIFECTGLRNRASLTAAVLRGGGAPRPLPGGGGAPTSSVRV
jgi:DNA-binding CsgD family transcriptional regulator